jgi:hypothetical protein
VWNGIDTSTDYEAIFLYDGSNIKKLTNYPYYGTYPQINDNGFVVWTGMQHYKGADGIEIFLYDGSTITQLTNNSYWDQWPKINNKGQVVWSGNGEVFLYDGTNTSLIGPGGDLQINNNGHVVWNRYDGSDGEIYLYDGSTTTQITDNSTIERNPQINSLGHVVWSGYEQPDEKTSEIFFYDGTNIIQLTDDSYIDQQPKINDTGDIAWISNRGSPENWEVMVYMNDSKNITPITNNSTHDTGVQINNSGVIVWQGSDGNDTEIYQAEKIRNSLVLYVDINATGTGDGLSWQNAFNHPQDAVDASYYGDQIWVADGTYARKLPTDTVVLTMKYGVDIYGGFAGGETDLSQRDFKNNVTILDAEGTDQNQSRVVIGADNTRLDGFTITGGYVSYNLGSIGGGMLNDGVSPIVENCIFNNNIAYDYGGAMYNKDNSPEITNCIFSRNTVWMGSGSAMYNQNSSPTITKCTFTKNSGFEAFDGGATMCNQNSSPTITKCTFSENVAESVGAMDNRSSSPTVINCFFSNNEAYFAVTGGVSNDDSSATFINCSFIGNRAGDIGAGGMWNTNSTVTITNCTFIGNVLIEPYLTDVAGGVANKNSTVVIANSTFTGNFTFGDSHAGALFNDPASIVYVANSILYNDFTITGSDGETSTSEIEGPATVTFSNIQGGYPGTGNIDANPLFVDPGYWEDYGTPDWDDIWVDGDYHLQAGSPCIDSGTEINAPGNDIEGTSRPQGLGYDMGAYERGFTCTDSDGDGYYVEGGDCGEADCNDSDDSIYPGATETCNGKDDDCDQQVDEGLRSTYYRDNDLDGYGDINSPTQACSVPSGYVTDNTDCDDNDASINPEGTEVCYDLKDNDCDGSPDCVDSECTGDIACADCTDVDGDNYSLEGGICGPVDCDDSNSAINPGASETCNEADDNCNGSVDEGVTTTFYLDVDSDGFALIHPAADEICNDNIDNDCDGQSDCNDTNCLTDPVCSSNGGDVGTGSGGCSIVGVRLSIEDALAGYGLLIIAGLWLAIRRRGK